MPQDSTKISIKKILKNTFGHDSLRDGQEEVINNILEGISTLCIFPTGSGKSLCYQLPAVALEGRTSIVISPLLSLIKDQLTQLEELGIPAATLNSSLSKEEKRKVIEDLEAGNISLLFMAPESFLKKEYQSLLKQLTIGIVAIDEAHCVSEWGNSFRPSYLLAANAERKLKPHAILALTATATKEVSRDIRSRFKIKTKDLVQTPLFRENLSYQVIPLLAEQKNQELVEILSQQEQLPAIVYVMKQVDAENVCGHLQAMKMNARSYHAGLAPDARKSVQDAFLSGELDIVVATIAFGMGVNKPNIRSVIHYHLPKSPEGWIQESGRAGRDGLPATCYLLGCGDDLIPLTNYILGAEVSKNAVTRILESIFSQGKDITISKYNLCQLHDINDSQFDIILSYLMTEGYITANDTSWRYYQVSRLRYTTHDYGRSKQNLVSAINDHWGRIDSTNAEETFGVSRSRLINIIEEMRDVGDVAVKTTGILSHFILKKELAKTDELAQEILKNFQSQKESSVKRVDAVISAATTRSCIPVRLIKYFGESLSTSCGKCSSCNGKKRSRKLPSGPIPSLTTEQVEILKNVYEEHKATLSTPHRLSKFACGIMSPAIRHARLYQNEHYSFLSHYPFADVFTQAKALIGG